MIQSLDRGISIMKYLARRKSAGVTEIAAEFDINKSTASRIMLTLMKHDMVCKDPETQKYRLSVGPLLFSYHVMSNHTIMEIAHPILVRLSEQTGETTHLCSLQNSRLYLLDQVKSERNKYMKDAALPGMIEPFHCSAAGKVLLAHMAPADAKMLLEDCSLNEYTKNTMVNMPEILEELRRVRERGFALDDQEFCYDLACIAVPVYDEFGYVSHAVGLSGPVTLANPKSVERLLPFLLEASRSLTEQYRARS